MLIFFVGIVVLLLFLAWDLLALIMRLFGFQWPSIFRSLWNGDGARPLTKEEKDWFYQQEREKQRQKRDQSRRW